MADGIYKRGNSWCIVYDLPRGENGKRRQKTQTGFRTRKEAERERTRILRELATGAFVEPHVLTVAEFLEQWLTDHARGRVRPKTFETYAEFVQLHLIPVLGRHKLTDLKPLHIQSYCREKLQNGRRDGHGGLAPRSVRHHLTVLKQALRQAVRWELLARNPAEAVDPPRVETVEKGALNVEETARLLQACSGSPLWLPVLMILATGMRRGEVLGLRWEDVNLERGEVAVRQILSQTKAGPVVQPPKTKKSRRRVPIPPVLVEALAAHRRRQDELRQLFGSEYQEHGLVVCREDGRQWRPTCFSHAFTLLVARAGIERVTVHELRHSHATLLLLLGENPKIVSERLGHTDISLTLQTYSHVLPGMQSEAVRKVDEVLRAALGRSTAAEQPSPADQSESGPQPDQERPGALRPW